MRGAPRDTSGQPSIDNDRPAPAAAVSCSQRMQKRPAPRKAAAKRTVVLPEKKLSAVILDFAEPGLATFAGGPTLEETRGVVDFLINVWNLNLYATPLWDWPHYLAEARRTLVASSPARELFEQYSERWQAHFADDPRSVGRWSIAPNGAGGFSLSCDTMLPQGCEGVIWYERKPGLAAMSFTQAASVRRRSRTSSAIFSGAGVVHEREIATEDKTLAEAASLLLLQQTPAGPGRSWATTRTRGTRSRADRRAGCGRDLRAPGAAWAPARPAFRRPCCRKSTSATANSIGPSAPRGASLDQSSSEWTSSAPAARSIQSTAP